MIYTQHGEPVEIVSSLAPEVIAMGLATVEVRSLKDPTWKRHRHLSTLKADGGVKEIEDAILKLYKK